MNLRRGIRRAMVFLSIVYWAMAVQGALARANSGEWGASGDPMLFLGCAAGVYALLFGMAWTLYGFCGRGSRRRYDDEARYDDPRYDDPRYDASRYDGPRRRW
jgi:hypothetical protein